jgi:hypothetical protein
MPDEQFGFTFDAPLVEMPVSQLPKRAPVPADLAKMDDSALIAHLAAIAEAIEETDIHYNAVLDLAGFPAHSQTGALRSRMLDAILPPNGNWQGYRRDGELRFRRLPPLELRRLPVVEDEQCRGELCAGALKPALTRGGALCSRCADAELEDLMATQE